MSYSPIDEDGVAQYPAVHADEAERATFLTKVYSLLLLGILVFAASAALPVYGVMNKIGPLASVAQAVAKVPPLVYFVGFLGISIAVHAVSMVRGLNIIAYFAFAALFGVVTSNLVLYSMARLGAEAGLSVVLQASVLTVFIFVGLSAYVFITRQDFSFMGGFLSAGMFTVLGIALLLILGGSLFGSQLPAVSLALSGVTVLLFAGYILYDTSQILHRYATDMVVPAALALLVDFIVLLRNLLNILISMRK